jgi:hypothetical protein
MDFVHRTFQEYLAAKEAAEEDRIGNLVGRAHLDLWRETIIMAAGHTNTRQREELLCGILERAEEEPRHARTLRLLAAGCQETLPSVSDGLAGRLDEAMTKLLPARRKTDPPALAAVGPSLLRWMPRSLGQLTEKAAEQTVRTVALIGGEESLDLLTGYVGDERQGVVKELIQAWGYFEADAYADKILSRLSLAGCDVPLTHSGQLHAASRLRSLTNIHIDYPVRGLGFLSEFPPLRRLLVTMLREETDLSVLRFHPGLERLLMFGSRSMEIASVLADLQELSWLAFSLPEGMDLNILHLLSKLEVVTLSNLKTGTDLSPLTALPNVWNMHLLGGHKRVPLGFEELAGMTFLKGLWLYGYNADDWLTTLKSAPPSLETLALNDCVLSLDRHIFARFEKLTHLFLSGCHTPDGKRITAMEIPGVCTYLT